jgi:hypothetical protein
MLVLKNKDAVWPELYPKVVRELGTVKKKGWVEVDGVRLRDGIDYIPQVGFQEILSTCDADVIFTGGQASAGKTMAILMEAMRGLGQQGYSAIILKKELVEVKTGGGILQDAKRLYLDIPGCQYTSSDNPTFEFPQWSSTIQLAHMNLQGDSQVTEAQEKMKNKQASAIMLDELTNFNFKIWKYWFSRNRDNSGMRPKMICTLNANGWHWSRRMLDWYIGDDNYVRPERIGVKKYFVIQGETVEEIIWGNSKQELVEKLGITVTPEMAAAHITPEHLVKSFTFIPGNLMDNRILTFNTQGGNVANLYQLGEAERMKLMYSFWGEMSEGEAQVTKAQIRDLFTNPWDGKTIMRLSIDIGDGGDASRCWVFKGNKLINIETTYTDDAPEKIAWIRHLKQKYEVDIQNICVDATGGGGFIDSTVKGVVGLVMNTTPIKEFDEEGNVLKFEQYVCLRDQLMGKLCSMIASQSLCIGIDPNTQFSHGKKGCRTSTLLDILLDQSECLKRFRKDNGKYFFVSKLEYKKSRGESPDDLDCFHMSTVYYLDATLKKEKEVEYTAFDYAGLYGNGWG